MRKRSGTGRTRLGSVSTSESILKHLRRLGYLLAVCAHDTLLEIMKRVEDKKTQTRRLRWQVAACFTADHQFKHAKIIER